MAEDLEAERKAGETQSPDSPVGDAAGTNGGVGIIFVGEDELGSASTEEAPLFYPWTVSSTGLWGEETGLLELRDRPAQELVEPLWQGGPVVETTALAELLSHGWARQAATVARALVDQHAEVEESIRAGFGNEVADYLLLDPLETIPRNPAEYPKEMAREYVL